MTKMYVQFSRNGFLGLSGTPWRHNIFTDPDYLSTATTLNNDSGVATNFSIQQIGGVLDSTVVSSFPSSTIDPDWPTTVFQRFWRSSSDVAGAATFRISGFSANQNVEIDIACYSFDNFADLLVDINGGTQGRYVLDNTDTPTGILTVSGAADNSGNVNINITPDPAFGGSKRAVVNGLIVTPGALGNTLTPTQTDYTFGDTITFSTTISNLTGATITDSQGNVMTLTSVTDTTAVIPSLSAGLNGVIVEDDLTLTVTDGTDTASASIDIIAPTGYTLTTLASIVDRDLIESDWIFGFDTPAVVGDQSLENSSIATHNNDGSANFTGDGTYSFFTIQASTGEVSEISKTIETESGGGNGSISELPFVKPIINPIINYF